MAPPPDASEAVLRKAAEDAGRAPSLLNTQPWRWRVRDGVLELWADHSRQVHSIDPTGRMLTIGCGTALHHARVAVARAGYEPVVHRLPDPAQPQLLAWVRLGSPRPVRRADIDLFRSISRRRSDRRPFPAIAPMPPATLAKLQQAAEAEQTRLYRIAPEQVTSLGLAAELAQTFETGDERYLQELHAWTRTAETGEGVPATTYVANVPRPVPVRDFARDGEIMQHPGLGDDRYAEYVVITTEADELADWLRAGEATSAVWLTATSRDLAASVISDVVEVPQARDLVTGMVPQPGYPQLLFRMAFDMQPAPPKASPRRRPDDIIDA